MVILCSWKSEKLAFFKWELEATYHESSKYFKIKKILNWKDGRKRYLGSLGWRCTYCCILNGWPTGSSCGAPGTCSVQDGYMCVHGRVPLQPTWNYHSILSRLYSSIKLDFFKKFKSRKDIKYLGNNKGWKIKIFGFFACLFFLDA